ncbi:MAG: cysteine desulfurase NifS [Candidatus Micrarchaeota archaeon]
MKRVYMDHAATSPLAPEVLAAMRPYFLKFFGNASSPHRFGREAKKALDESRTTIARALDASPEEVIFTSGGSESDNLALVGAARAYRSKGNHIITSAIEHPAVLNTCKYLEKQGFRVSYAPVSRNGIVDAGVVERAITKDTILISIMHANNEIGTIQPIMEIGRIARERGILFHTDAVQTFGKIPFDVRELGVDLLSMSAHKLCGPKGVGALFVKKGARLEPLIYGGNHERNMRAGTENISGIVGFAKAAEIARAEMKREGERLTRLRDKMITELLKIDDSWLNGHPKKRLPNNANFGFRYIEGEAMVLYLDAKGIAASTGSACSSHSLQPSHVLLALGLSPEEAHGSLRLTLGRENAARDADYLLDVLPPIVEKLRKMSPLGKGVKFKPSEGYGHEGVHEHGEGNER